MKDVPKIRLLTNEMIGAYPSLAVWKSKTKNSLTEFEERTRWYHGRRGRSINERREQGSNQRCFLATCFDAGIGTTVGKRDETEGVVLHHKSEEQEEYGLFHLQECSSGWTSHLSRSSSGCFVTSGFDCQEESIPTVFVLYTKLADGAVHQFDNDGQNGGWGLYIDIFLQQKRTAYVIHILIPFMQISSNTIHQKRPKSKHLSFQLNQNLATHPISGISIWGMMKRCILGALIFPIIGNITSQIIYPDIETVLIPSIFEFCLGKRRSPNHRNRNHVLTWNRYSHLGPERIWVSKQFFSGQRQAPQCKWRWRLVEEDDVTRRSEPAVEVN